MDRFIDFNSNPVLGNGIYMADVRHIPLTEHYIYTEHRREERESYQPKI